MSKTSGTSAVSPVIFISLQAIVDKRVNGKFRGLVPWEPVGSYDQFLGILANDEQRGRLETLRENEAEPDQLYQHVRAISHEFRNGLLTFFFDPKSWKN